MKELPLSPPLPILVSPEFSLPFYPASREFEQISVAGYSCCVCFLLHKTRTAKATLCICTNCPTLGRPAEQQVCSERQPAAGTGLHPLGAMGIFEFHKRATWSSSLALQSGGGQGERLKRTEGLRAMFGFQLTPAVKEKTHRDF